jgi:hypothetical protein
MKTQIIFLLLLFNVVQLCHAQAVLREVFKIRDTLRLERYTPSSEEFNFQKVEMNAGDHRILNASKVESLRSQHIMAVDLVYSDYPVGDDFTELNRKRFLELSKFLPNAFNDKHIKWRVVVQTGVSKTGNINSYFHGFAVYYRNYDLSAELGHIDGVLSGRPLRMDSLIFKVLERNKDWKNMLVVMDVTGSMSPYTAQLILWLKLNTGDKRFKHFTFFNDGDEKSSERKEIGKTGGIYHIVAELYEEVAKKVKEAMSKGSGGDIQENDIEALLAGIKECPECKDIVLVADNYSPCRDLSLLKELKKPVKVILCGAQRFINVEYLQIARVTGGSVHTIESDILDLMKMKEGQTIDIDGRTYRIEKDKFVLLPLKD